MSASTLLRELLQKIPSTGEGSFHVQQAKRGLVGGALGAGAGWLASDDDDYTPMAYGAALGAAAGAFTTHQIPEQIPPSTDWGRPQDLPGSAVKAEPTSLLDRSTRALKALVYDRQPWAQVVPKAALDQADVSLGGGLGQAEDILAEPTRLIRGVRQASLGKALDEYMRINTGLRGWEHLQRMKEDYVGRAREAMLRGEGYDGPEISRLRDLYRGIDDTLTSKKVTFNDATVEELKAAQAQQRAALGDEAYNQVAGAANALYDAHANVRKRLFDEGLIDEQQYGIWEAEHTATPYSPGYRSFAEEAPDGSYSIANNVRQLRAELGRRGVSVKSLDNIIQRLEGSDAPYKDPVLSSLFHVNESVSNISRNRAAKALIQGAMENRGEHNIVPGTNFYIREAAPGEQVRPDEGVVSYFEGGQRKDFVVPGEYADVLNVAQAGDISRGMRVISKVQRAVNSFITSSNMAFTLANIPKDVLEAAVYTPVWKNPLTFGKLWGQAVKEIFQEDFLHQGQGQLRQAGRQAGIGHATFTRNMQEMPAYEALMSDDLSAGQKTLQWFQNVLNMGEEATKLATFGTLKEHQAQNGLSDLDIAAMTRRYGGSPDFARGGTARKELGAFYTFFNPIVQGLHRFYEKGMDDPAWLMKSMGALSMGVLAADTYNRSFQDDQGKPLLEQIDPQVRMNNLVLLTGGTEVTSQGHVAPQYVRIPLGHVGVALMTPMFEALRLAHGEPGASVGQAAADVASPLLPINGTLDAERPVSSALTTTLASLNPLLRYGAEEALNETAFNGVPIVGRRLEKLEPAYQYTDTTSPTMVKAAHLIGQVPGLNQLSWLTSPQRLEHGYRTFFPGAMEFPLTALDARQVPVAQGEYEEVSRLPVLGPMFRRFLPTGQDAQRDVLAEKFYGFMNDAENVAATFQAQETPETRAAYLEGHRNQILGARALAPVARAIGQLGEQRRRLLQDPSLSPEERRAQLQTLYQEQMRLLQRGNDLILQLEGD